MIARSQSCHNPRCLSACPGLVRACPQQVRNFGRGSFLGSRRLFIETPHAKRRGILWSTGRRCAGLCEPETQLEPEPLRSDLLNLDLESPLQFGSAAKAAFNLERSCPIWSMAPVVAIM